MNTTYIHEVEVNLGGEPFTVGVLHFHHIPPFRGSRYHCDSDIDWHGNTEIDWQVINPYNPDTNPYEYCEFQEFVDSLNDHDLETIEEQIIETILNQAEDNRAYDQFMAEQEY